MIAPSSYGALSATSANTIQGSRPGFTGHSGAKKLGFKIGSGNTTYSESEGNLSPLSSGVINYFDAGLTLNDFKVTNLTASDFSPANDYADADGDVAHPTTPFSMSPRTFVWKDRNGATITNYNQTLGCGSSLNLPLTLRITLPDVNVKSRYGNPSESIPTPLVQEYKIGTATGICFAKPNSLHWVGHWNVSADPTHGGGYNTAQFDPNNGFKASLNPKFPTTGFPGAEFTLIMTSNASDYTFSSNDTAVEVDTSGKVTLNSKPSGAVTIKVIFKNDTSQVHSYTFNPTTVWVIPSSTYMNYASAVSTCGGTNRIPSCAELTNSPLNNVGLGDTIIDNAGTRAVGGGVFGEWGRTASDTYANSQWSYSPHYYWTRNSYSSNDQFRVFSFYGSVYYGFTNPGPYVACLE
ncbi:hypothetical protein RCS94_07400 [Orbaceae bacterium ac157xtp]